MTVPLYVGSPLGDCPSLCCSRTAPKDNEEEGRYASRFDRWFWESSKSCLLLLVALPSLINTLAQLLAWRSLLCCLWRGDEGTWHRVISSAQHGWPDLWHCIYCFVSAMRSLYGRRKYAHTHTHTHTHIHNTSVILTLLMYDFQLIVYFSPVFVTFQRASKTQ